MDFSDGPSKTQIETVFNRLRAQGSNKVKFDLNFRSIYAPYYYIYLYYILIVL